MALTVKDHEQVQNGLWDLREEERGEERKREIEQSRLAAWRRLKTRGSWWHPVPVEKAETVTHPTLIIQKTQGGDVPPDYHHSNTLHFSSIPPCIPYCFPPSGGERHCASPPARWSCTVKGTMLTVTTYEREEGRLSGDFHMNKDQHNTV